MKTAHRGEERGEVTAAKPVARGPWQAKAGGEDAGQAATAPPMVRWERGTRQGHPEGQLQRGGRFTAPAALLPSSVDAFLREEQVHNL